MSCPHVDLCSFFVYFPVFVFFFGIFSCSFFFSEYLSCVGKGAGEEKKNASWGTSGSVYGLFEIRC